MINQDYSKHFDYIKNTEEKLSELYNNAKVNFGSEILKSNINKIYTKISVQIIELNSRLKSGNIIKETEWNKYISTIDMLLQEMQDHINQQMSIVLSHNNLRQ